MFLILFLIPTNKRVPQKNYMYLNKNYGTNHKSQITYKKNIRFISINLYKQNYKMDPRKIASGASLKYISDEKISYSKIHQPQSMNYLERLVLKVLIF